KFKDVLLNLVNFLSVYLDGLINFSIISFIFLLILFLGPWSVKALFSIPRRYFLLPGLFLFVGVVYFIGIVYMRFTAYFDSFDFRLLGPATFMVSLFIVSWISTVDKRDWHHWQLFLAVVLLIACVIK